MNILDDDIDYQILPVVNFKYYNSDDFVITLGLKAKKAKIYGSGDVDPTLFPPLISREYKDDVSDIMLVPGFEKHFLASNILDIYVGLRVPLGYRKDVLIDNIEYSLTASLDYQIQLACNQIYQDHIFHQAIPSFLHILHRQGS